MSSRSVFHSEIGSLNRVNSRVTQKTMNAITRPGLRFSGSPAKSAGSAPKRRKTSSEANVAVIHSRLTAPKSTDSSKVSSTSPYCNVWLR